MGGAVQTVQALAGAALLPLLLLLPPLLHDVPGTLHGRASASVGAATSSRIMKERKEACAQWVGSAVPCTLTHKVGAHSWQQRRPSHLLPPPSCRDVRGRLGHRALPPSLHAAAYCPLPHGPQSVQGLCRASWRHARRRQHAPPGRWAAPHFLNHAPLRLLQHRVLLLFGGIKRQGSMNALLERKSGGSMRTRGTRLDTINQSIHTALIHSTSAPLLQIRPATGCRPLSSGGSPSVRRHAGRNLRPVGEQGRRRQVHALLSHQHHLWVPLPGEDCDCRGHVPPGQPFPHAADLHGSRGDRE